MQSLHAARFRSKSDPDLTRSDLPTTTDGKQPDGEDGGPEDGAYRETEGGDGGEKEGQDQGGREPDLRQSNRGNKTVIPASASQDGGKEEKAAVVAAGGQEGGLPECPMIPPDLRGRFPVEIRDVPSMEKIEEELSHLQKGGRFQPPGCKARHRVAIIVPYRDREHHLRIFLLNIHRSVETDFKNIVLILFSCLCCALMNRY